MDALILITSRWDLEFHVHIDMSNLVIDDMLAQNPIKKYNQLIVYMFQLLNNAKKNYTTTKREALVMVYTFHKYYHYLLSNKFVFDVDHMALFYLVKKPQVSSWIAQWLLLFFKYDFQWYINLKNRIHV